MSDPKALALQAQTNLNAAADALDAAFDAKGVQPRPTFGTVLRQKGVDAVNTVELALANLASLPGPPPQVGIAPIPATYQGMRVKAMRAPPMLYNVFEPNRWSEGANNRQITRAPRVFLDGSSGLAKNEALVSEFVVGAPAAPGNTIKLGITEIGTPTMGRSFILSDAINDPFDESKALVTGKASKLALTCYVDKTVQGAIALVSGRTYRIAMTTTGGGAGDANVYLSWLYK